MLKELEQLVGEERWADAREMIVKLEQELPPSDRFAVLNATVYMEEGRFKEAHQCITVGIICNPSNYELYYLLGNYYLNRNINQAYLCYEQALFYCEEEQGREMLRENLEFIKGLEGFGVHPVSIVILSYNVADVLKGCIESIRKNHAESMYELVVVDNASSDGVDRWLREQPDIILQCNESNEGFANGCNQGIQLAAAENDILLLNNDTIVPPNALFWLRMGLYERETVGAVGPLSNYASNGQQINVQYDTAEEYLKLAESIHIPMQCHVYENKVYLMGFAMLIKRCAVDEIGMLDTRYERGGWEDTDYGMSLNAAGYECLLCTNAFIYHYGSLTMFSEDNESRKKYNYYMPKNHRLLSEKWGFDPAYYGNIRTHLIDMVQKEQDACFRVLEVGCGYGATLSHIKWKYRNAQVYGIELEENVAGLGKYMGNIVAGNIETMELPFAENMFDYIIFGDVLEHLRNPKKVVEKCKNILRKDGKVLASIPNLLNVSVIAPLLRGRFQYTEAGLLDQTHIHLFTRYEIEKMFSLSGYRVLEWYAVNGMQSAQMQEGDEQLIDEICKLPGVAQRWEFDVYQFLILAELR